ncbi:hypothetical protein PVAND_015413 [Polypedilum vanderplanki]|uniref:G-protein coupled receptors family 1 profile domain-containing protein n=1 Tax=Polypedilum vanderplanki TaxID=319348 RepID=A0A9J6BC38_POLVA|nr:hypothetical protein PVAND_015413 [Polypedilum vanderplanki]
MFNNFEYFYDETNFSSFNHDYDYEEENIPDLIVVYESAVMPLSKRQRIIFFVLTSIVSFLAIIGNALVLYVNFTRKQRLLFRTCLISLAISDMIYTQVTAVIYLPRLFISQSALWVLGPLTCAIFPFLQTFSILVNSILLVCIAMDRYMAVVRVTKAQWEPGKLFCVTCCVLVWGMAAGVSSPMLTIYQYFKIYIVPYPEHPDDKLTYYIGHVCASHKDENAYYFSIIFSFIFAPLVLTFVWMNSVVARQIWSRRHFGQKPTPQQQPIPSISGEQSQAKTEVSAISIERKKRQVRLFKVILLLMIVFFLCRLPSWIYTIYKLNNDSDTNVEWILNYSFGVLALTNCLLNPYLYTFLSETIRLMSFLSSVIRGLCGSICLLCRKKREDNENSSA